EADESGKDVSRLCFLSWDISIFVNENEVEVFGIPAEEPAKPKAEAKTKTTTPADLRGAYDAFQKLRKFTDNKFSYSEGSRNQYINAFVMNCKTHGIDKADCDFYCQEHFSDYVAE